MPLGAATGLWKIFLFLNWMKWNSKEKKILNLFFRRMCAYDFLHRENFRGRTVIRLILGTKKTAPYNFFKLFLSHYFSTIFRMMTSPTQSKRSVTSLWRHQKKGQNEISTQHGRMIHQWKAMISEISNMKLFLTYDVIAWRHKGKTVKNGHFRPFLPLNSVIWYMLSHHIVMK